MLVASALFTTRWRSQSYIIYIILCYCTQVFKALKIFIRLYMASLPRINTKMKLIRVSIVIRAKPDSPLHVLERHLVLKKWCYQALEEFLQTVHYAIYLFYSLALPLHDLTAKLSYRKMHKSPTSLQCTMGPVAPQPCKFTPSYSYKVNSGLIQQWNKYRYIYDRNRLSLEHQRPIQKGGPGGRTSPFMVEFF